MRRLLVRSLVAATALLSGGLVVALGAPPAWATVNCTSSINNTTVNDSVFVPSGATCVIFNSTVNGNVIVGTGASITLVGATVTGTFVSSGAHDIRMGNCSEFGCAVPRPTLIKGSVLIQGTTGVPFFPTKNVICDATFTGGNVVLQSNRAPFAIGTDPQCFAGGGDRVGANLVLSNNTAPITLAGNQISGLLECVGNSPAPVNGGGNVAAGKGGQCAAF
jgi:hypothetical protein